MDTVCSLLLPFRPVGGRLEVLNERLQYSIRGRSEATGKRESGTPSAKRSHGALAASLRLCEITRDTMKARLRCPWNPRVSTQDAMLPGPVNAASRASRR